MAHKGSHETAAAPGFPPPGATASDDGAGPIRTITILGGGTAGWISAALLARALTGTGTAITLIESPAIGLVGVGEATIPPFVDMLGFLGIDLADFIRNTEATFKLAIRFDGWNGPGTSYWHPFGPLGAGIGQRPFHHAMLRASELGLGGTLADFNLCAALGERDAVPAPDAPLPPGARIALHVDALRVAGYLAQYAMAQGVTRIEATVDEVTRDPRGHVASVHCTDGRAFAADLWIDASGFAARLIGEMPGADYIDWRAHLPCDSAWAVPTARQAGLAPYTTATAMDAGWRWRIPLQHRTGNGHVWSSAHTDEAAARDALMAAIDGPPLAEPRLLRFVPGRRRQAWVGNCLAVGLASGFLEPLESTSIHLVGAAIQALLDHFPDRRFDPATIASFNAEWAQDLEDIRDFLILHYALTQRRDTPFWTDMAAAPLPDSLAARIALYADAGVIRTGPRALFTVPSWFYVFDGMGLTPRRSDPLLGAVPPDRMRTMLATISRDTLAGLDRAVPHAALFPPPAPSLHARTGAVPVR